MKPKTSLGDSHNFGRRVSVRGSHIVKPRTVLWEWLALGVKSPLRRLFDDLADAEDLGTDAFQFLPRLEFSRSKSGEGVVDRVELRPLSRISAERRRELARVVGRSIALWSWLGVADLHWENLVIGADARGRIIFAPLDVEMILADLALPTATKLLPDSDPEYAAISQHAAGVRRALPWLGKPLDVGDLVAMASDYRGTLELLDRHATAIAEVFARLPRLRETPIRVCLRGTDEYVRARTEPIWPPLLDAEAEQLARGDIPYFFRLYGRPGIHHYADRSLRRVARIPLRGDVPKLDPILQLGRGLRSPSRRSLREEGLFTVLGAFDHPSFAGRHRAGDLEVRFGARTLVVKLDTGEELSSRRDLRAFVSSVYLPCRCGEVRTVFVPGRTVCEATAR